MKRMCKKLSALFALCAVAMAVFGFAVPGAQADVTATDVENLHLQKLTHAPQNHFAADQRFYFTFTPASDEYGTGATTADTPAAGNIVGAQDDNLIAKVDGTTDAIESGEAYTRTGQSGLEMQVGEDYSRENLDGKVFLPIASEFPHAGVYAYVVTENANVNGQVIDAVTYSQAQYIMRVYVTNTQIENAEKGLTSANAYPTVTLERIKTDDGQTTLADEQIGKSTDNTTNNLSDKVGKVNPTTLTNVIRNSSEEDANTQFHNNNKGDGSGSANEDYVVDSNTTYSACPPNVFKSAYAKGFEFYNDYNKSANTKLTFTKLVDGEYGDKLTQYFDFEMDIRLAEEHIALSNDYVAKHEGSERLDYYKSIENAVKTAFTNDLGLQSSDYTISWKLLDASGSEITVNQGAYAQLQATASDSLILHATFKAKHGDTFTIANVIPESSGYAVTETGLSSIPYTPSASYSQVVTSTENRNVAEGEVKTGPDGSNLYTYTTSQRDNSYTGGDTYEVKNWDSSTSALPTKVFNQSSITITNTYKENAVTPTGIFVANAPYLILVGVPVVGLVVWFVRRRQNAHRA
ncbi:MAG: hypothetical protein Q4B54_03320 [Coriobacteriales bacterium]|nr:hypothetical protein [Coriobacteriales bacterium]